MISTVRAACAGLLLLACVTPLTAQSTGPAERSQLIKVIARDYVYDAPSTVVAGVTTIQLINQGADIHHVSVQELPDGKTVKDFFDATRNGGSAPAWSRSLAQTAIIPNGAEAFIAFRMPPGRYILSCLIPASDGRSHVAKGMYQVITAAAPAAARQGTARPTGAIKRP